MAKRANAKTIEANSSHVAYISHAKETAKHIEEAATSLKEVATSAPSQSITRGLETPPILTTSAEARINVV